MLLCGTSAWAVQVRVDGSKLPPAAPVQVDFDRDILPLFERSCFKCHGPERPKGKFRLDQRAAALKGGENGVDILPGQGSKSPLVHYVAGLVPDMEMPPKGKGEPLTPEQIALLRAWIDQGANWGTTRTEPQTQVVATPTVGWTTVRGSESTFREHFWRPEGWNGGVEKFELTQRIDDSTRLYLEGRALRDDYRLSLEVNRQDVGFTRFGVQQYRKYFSDVGGYYPTFTPPVYSLGRDLHLDIGKAWFDVGLTLPDWPRMVLGYEYQYQQGEKSTLQWGSVAQGLEANGDPRARNIYPAFKHLDEKVHILKFDLDHEWVGYHFEDNFRAEFYHLETSRTNITFEPASSTYAATGVGEGYRHFQGANSFRVERSFKDWLYGSGGYHYSKLSADSSFSQEPILLTGVSIPLVVEQVKSSPIVLERESHTFNLNGLLGPWDGLSFSAGVQSEWTRQKGVGTGEQQFIFTSPGFTPITNGFRLDANLDRAAVEENLVLRFTKIPFTVLFAEARLQQESIGQYEDQIGGIRDFKRQTDAAGELRDYRAGFTTSPWQRVSFSSHYRRYEKINRYDHNTDLAFGSPNEGYSAFIRSRDTYTDEAEAKVVWHAASWLKATFKYQLVSSDMFTGTDPVSGDVSPGGRIYAGNYDAHVFSIGGIITPWQRVYLSSTFSLQDARTVTAANNSPSIAPYKGQIYSLINNITFALNPRTDLFANYNFSMADFSQNNFSEGLPLGVNYQQHAMEVGFSRKILQNFVARGQYGFFLYDDLGLGHASDYTAHAVFGTLTMRWP
ncbi:MAG: Planctomycete cytochrome [Verrucomicrobiales bacterium]|nr:Planctomycete cytochrome [Verrucomicrobiales bacterium]